MIKTLFFYAFFLATLSTAAQTPTFNWAEQMKGIDDPDNRGSAIALDAEGNVFTTGYFKGTVDFDPGVGLTNVTANGGGTLHNTFISKLDSAGNFVWVKNIGGTNIVTPVDIAVASSGNMYVTGFFRDTADFDPGSAVFNLIAGAGSSGNTFILKLDPSGNFIWAGKLACNHVINSSSLIIDAMENIYVVGDFTGTADFDPGAGSAELTSISSTDAFVLKLDSGGNFVWAKHMGSNATANNSVTAIESDTEGNLYLTGSFQGTIDFEPGSGLDTVSAWGTAINLFVAKLDADGNFGWAKGIGGTVYQSARSIALDHASNIIIAGDFNGTTDFDPGADTSYLTNTGITNGYVLKLDPSGNFIWVKGMQGSGYATNGSLKTDAYSNIYTMGNFMSTIDFDPGTATHYLLVHPSIFNAFVCELNPDGDFIAAAGTDGYPGEARALDMTIDDAGHIFTTGFFEGTVDFDPGAGISDLVGPGGLGGDIFIQKLNGPVVHSGISENEFDSNSLSVYPNPATDQLTISLNDMETMGSIAIVNYLGEIVYSGTSCNTSGKQSLTVDVSGFAKGIYFIEMKTKNENGSKKFIRE